MQGQLFFVWRHEEEHMKADVGRTMKRVRQTFSTVSHVMRRGWVLVRHPAHRSCLDCGFLEYSGEHLTDEQRSMLYFWVKTGAIATLPHLDKIWCYKGSWISAAMNYTGPCPEAVKDELSVDRRTCPGWFRYRIGYSPQEHVCFEKERWTLQANRATIALGAGVGAVTGAVISWILNHPW